MQPKHLNLQILSEQVDLHSFNCGDEDLNDFLINKRINLQCTECH